MEFNRNINEKLYPVLPNSYGLKEPNAPVDEGCMTTVFKKSVKYKKRLKLRRRRGWRLAKNITEL